MEEAVKKEFKIGFYRLVKKAENASAEKLVSSMGQLVMEILNLCFGRANPVPRQLDGGYHFQLQELEIDAAGQIACGVLKKFDNDELPSIGVIGQVQDRPMDDKMDDDEWGVHRAHFLYYAPQGILILQHNRHGIAAKKIAGLLKAELTAKSEKDMETASAQCQAGTSSEQKEARDMLRAAKALALVDVQFAIVFTKHFYEKIRDDALEIRDFDIEFARASSPKFIDQAQDDWERYIVGLLDKFGTDKLRLSTVGNVANRSGARYLAREAVRAFAVQAADQVNRAGSRKANKITFVDADGDVHPVDLVADRLVDTIEVSMVRKTPNQQEFFTLMKNSLENHRQDIQDVFGDDD